MKNHGLIKIMLYLVLCLGSCTLSNRKENEIIEKIDLRTGEAIATDNFIQKYEGEHQQFYEQEFKNGGNLKWPDLDNKNLSNYCRKYFQHSIPSRSTENTIAFKIKRELHYEKKNTSKNNRVVIIVQCKVKRKMNKTNYYITRAPELNCVYSLKYKSRVEPIFTIINKYCDFEDKPLLNSSLKHKRADYIRKKHLKTGQPIAKDEYLLEYELEHQELLKQRSKNGTFIKWPYVMDHSNLDSYCHQYIRACSPRRNLKNITGRWRAEKLHYQKLKTNKDIDVITVVCLLPNVAKRFYIMTRAPETNCVYALLRTGHSTRYPFTIIFKHCDFEHQNYQQTSSHEHDIFDNHVVQKAEMKEEILEKLETHQLFPID